MERPNMAHLTMASSSKKPFKKAKVTKESKVMMHLTMGKRKKIRCNVIFPTRKITKEEIVLVLRLD